MGKALQYYQALRDSLGGGKAVEALCCNIHQVIQAAICAVPADARLAIRPRGEHTEMLLKSFDFSKKNIVGIISRTQKGGMVCGYPCLPAAEPSPDLYDTVFISSFHYHREIRDELKKTGIAYIDPYDALERENLSLMAPFYLYQPGWPMALNYFYLKCMNCLDSQSDHEEAVRAFLQAAVEYKDFVMIDRVYKEFGGADGKYPLLIECWEKTQKLLGLISSELRARSQQDIFAYWTDAVSYRELQYMPETQKQEKEGCSFLRAHTHTPYTGSTLRAMFKNELPIDDFSHIAEEINRDNSPLIRYLEDAGYEVKCMFPFRWKMDAQYIVNSSEFSSCSVVWWNGLEAILKTQKPCFCLYHFAAESHPPILSPDLRHPAVDLGKESEQRDAQISTVYHYLDQCLSLYRRLAGDKIQIFFSDHGPHIKACHDWTETKLHPYCFVTGRGIGKQEATRFFPYRNFWKLVRWIREGDPYSLEDICADEVLFQDIDFYNPSLVEKCISQDTPYNGISYRGICSYDYKYVIDALGNEFFYHITKDGKEILKELKDDSLRTELKNKCGTEFIDIYQFDKFKAARKLHEYLKSRPKPNI